jgi:hypothetical protein
MEKDSPQKPLTRKGWMREPLVWFLIVGASLNGVLSWIEDLRRPKAVVTAEWLQTLSSDSERRNGVPLSHDELVSAVHQELEREILYREALKQGRTEDPRVRGLLAAILREELEPVLADPSDEELRAYREKHPDAYQFPEQVSFSHVSFATKESVPERLLDRLRAGDSVAGDPAVKLANPLPMTWLPQVKALFGDEFLEELEKCKPGEWHGPFPSKRGVHFVKLIERRPPREMSFEEVKPALTSQWLKDKKAEAVSAKVEEMRRGYRVVLPKGIPEP